MRIRYKYFVVLLAFSLIPLLVVTTISRRHINHLGTTLAEGARDKLTALIIRDLEQVAIRARRIDGLHERLLLLAETSSEAVLRQLGQARIVLVRRLF